MALIKIYLISLDENDYYETNEAGELLFFEGSEQIAEYANANDIDFERITVYPMEVDDMDTAFIKEVEF